uniref:Uncharacterized protein n=1 Tax=Hippocampus comes TaxID=109280 RepID=A0A3Q2Z726_HIPCM
MYGHEDCVKALVYYDFQTCCLDLHNDKGDTPLHLASRWGYEAIIRVLLENGAGVRALNNSAHTPVHCALNSKVLTLLQEAQEQRCRNGGGGGSGSQVCSHKRQKSRRPGSQKPKNRWLLTSCPMTCCLCPAPFPPRQSPARVCPQASERSARRSSTSSGTSSSPDRELPPESAPARHRQVEKLLRAVADGDVQMVRYLLEWTDEDEADALAEASLCHPLCQCTTCAPAHKARAVPCGALSAKSANADGVTPLHVACTYGRAELTSLLVRHGADVDARTDRKATPLHLASQNNHLQVVKFLLECNAKLNKKDRYGNTALIHACLHGNLDTAATLIQSEALVNVRNRQGNTALHCAVRAGHQGLVDILLKAGASPHLLNKKHRTPLDAAYQQGGKNTEIVRSLQKASGLSPDDEPIKLLSVPKGALAHSFVQRLRHNDAARHKSAASRIQQTKNASCSPTRRSAAPEQASPNVRRLRRGGTVDAVGPTASSDGSPCSRGRGLARWHTLDSGEEAPQPPIKGHARTRRRHDDDDAQPVFVMTSSFSNGQTPNAAVTEQSDDDDDACRDVISGLVASSIRHVNTPRLQDAPISSDVSAIKDTSLSGDTSLIKDAPPTRDTPNSSDKSRIQDTPVSSDAPDIKDTRLVRDESLSSENLDCSETPHVQDTPILGVTSNIKDTSLSCDVPLIKDAPRTWDTPNSSDVPRIQDTPVSRDVPDIKDTPLVHDESLSSENLDSSETPRIRDTAISSVTSDLKDAFDSRDMSLIKNTRRTGDTPNSGDIHQDTPVSGDASDMKGNSSQV